MSACRQVIGNDDLMGEIVSYLPFDALIRLGILSKLITTDRILGLAKTFMIEADSAFERRFRFDTALRYVKSMPLVDQLLRVDTVEEMDGKVEFLKAFMPQLRHVSFRGVEDAQRTGVYPLVRPERILSLDTGCRNAIVIVSDKFPALKHLSVTLTSVQDALVFFRDFAPNHTNLQTLTITTSYPRWFHNETDKLDHRRCCQQFRHWIAANKELRSLNIEPVCQLFKYLAMDVFDGASNSDLIALLEKEDIDELFKSKLSLPLNRIRIGGKSVWGILAFQSSSFFSNPPLIETLQIIQLMFKPSIFLAEDRIYELGLFAERLCVSHELPASALVGLVTWIRSMLLECHADLIPFDPVSPVVWAAGLSVATLFVNAIPGPESIKLARHECSLVFGGQVKTQQLIEALKMHKMRFGNASYGGSESVVDVTLSLFRDLLLDDTSLTICIPEAACESLPIVALALNPRLDGRVRFCDTGNFVCVRALGFSISNLSTRTTITILDKCDRSQVKLYRHPSLSPTTIKPRLSFGRVAELVGRLVPDPEWAHEFLKAPWANLHHDLANTDVIEGFLKGLSSHFTEEQMQLCKVSVIDTPT